MTPQLRNILDLITPDKESAPVTPGAAVELSERYPFFTLPAVLALRLTPPAEMERPIRERLMRQIALNSSDPRRAFLMADIDYIEWADFYPIETKEVTTGDAITKFLETYGHYDPHEEALLERLIFNPTPDYASVLERRDREEHRGLTPPPPAADSSVTPSQDALINSFILKHLDDESSLLPRDDTPLPPPVSDDSNTQPLPTPVMRRIEKPAQEHTVPSQAPAPGTFDSSLSESLAKIYIRQKRYDKAFEIIHTLSLNNPKKSSYLQTNCGFCVSSCSTAP